MQNETVKAAYTSDGAFAAAVRSDVIIALPFIEVPYELAATLTSRHFWTGTAWEYRAPTNQPTELEMCKTAKWAEVKQHRDATENGGFTWDGSSFDSTPISQSRIQGAAQLATLAKINNQPFSIDWTLADNSVRTLSGDDMIAVGAALGAHINEQHVRARQLREQIEAATTPEQVQAVRGVI